MTSLMIVFLRAILWNQSPALGGDIPKPEMGRLIEVESSQRELTEEEKAQQLAFVRRVVNTSADQLDVPTIQKFLYGTIPTYLPEPDRRSYFDKREQLQSAGKGSSLKLSGGLLRLQQMNERAQAKQKPTKETPEMLLMAGLIELKEQEAKWLLKVTKCSIDELPENSTFRVIEDSQSGKKVVRYFIHPRDPVFILVANSRAGRTRTRGSSFFGQGGGGALCH